MYSAHTKKNMICTKCTKKGFLYTCIFKGVLKFYVHFKTSPKAIFYLAYAQGAQYKINKCCLYIIAPGSMPQDVTPVAVDRNPLAVTLNWQPPQKPNGQITGEGRGVTLIIRLLRVTCLVSSPEPEAHKVSL